MGRIRCTNDGKDFVLWSQTLIGRDPVCSLSLGDPETAASAIHARIFYREGEWWLTDLGSRNGTFLVPRGGMEPIKIAVEHEGSRRLRAGDRVRFGDEREEWVVEDLGSPFPEAEDLDTGRRIPSHGAGVLLIDSGTDLLSVSPGEDGIHRLRLPDAPALPLPNPPIVELGGRRHRITFEPMARTPPPAHELTEGTLEYSEPAPGASRLELVIGPHRNDLGTYVCYRMIGILARTRLSDERRQASPDEVGWVSREELSERLGRSLRAVAVDLHRCQEHLKAAGIGGVEHLLEKRSGRRLRLGHDVSVRVIEAPSS